MKDSVRPDFEITTAMRENFRARLEAKGVSVERAEWDAGSAYVDRLLLNRIARLAYGDSTAKRREIADDTQLRSAIDYLRRGRTTAELLALAPTVTLPATAEASRNPTATAPRTATQPTTRRPD